LLSSLFGSLASQLSTINFTAAINGEFATTEHVLATRGGARFVIDFSYLSIGKVPPIQAPTGS